MQIENPPSSLFEFVWRSVLETAQSLGEWAVWIVVVVFFLAVAVWEREKIQSLPGVAQLLEFFKKRPLPRPDPKRFSVGVARLDLDDGNEVQRLVVESLSEFRAIHVLIFDERIRFSTQDPHADERKGHERARDLLRRSGVDVLVWGAALKQGDKLVPKLYLTQSAIPDWEPSGERYLFSSDLALPQVFSVHLTALLAFVVNALAFKHKGGHHNVPTKDLNNIVDRLREFLDKDLPVPQARTAFLEVYAGCLVTLSESVGNRRWFDEALTIYSELARVVDKTVSPQRWARIRNDYGFALLSSAQDSSDSATFERGREVLESALTVFQKDTHPLDWARVHHNLSNAYKGLARSKADTGLIHKAIELSRVAVESFDKQEHRELWALARNGLGIGHVMLAERALQSGDESGLEYVREALEIYGNVLASIDLDSAPALWAYTHENRGNALKLQSTRENSFDLCCEAIRAYEKALTVLTKERARLQWTRIVSNLGSTLIDLARLDPDVNGELEDGDRAEAVSTLKSNGHLLNRRHLRDAEARFRDALEGVTRSSQPLLWAYAHFGLGRSLVGQGAVKETCDLICKALEHLLQSWEVFRTLDHFILPEIEAAIDNTKGMIIFAATDGQACFETLRSELTRFRELRKSTKQVGYGRPDLFVPPGSI